jgi:uncharacterized Ntn-hydrolase superfamily protein
LTYSIVARDAASGQLGVAVQSHALAVGGLCPWASPEVGAVATQAMVEVAYGPRLLRALGDGVAPDVALRALTGADAVASTRQVAAVDTAGRVAVHTGADCIAEAGHRTGDGFSVQANMMRDPGVPDAMADAFSAARGTLVRRLLATLEAAEAAGGDLRGRQSAAIKVVGGPGDTGGELSGWLVDVRVDDAAEPLRELRRLVELHEATHAPGPEAAARVAELSRGNPEGWFWHGVTLANEGRVEEARAALGLAFAASDGDQWRQLLQRIPMLLPADPDLLRQLGQDV